MMELQEAAKEFLIESHENLEQLDLDLVGLERAADPADALGRIFRSLHTIKGSCSFLGFPRLEALAHAGETLLGKLRSGEIAMSSSITDGLLRMVDAIRGILAVVENTGGDGHVDSSELVDLLTRLAAGESSARTFGPRAEPVSAKSLEFSLAENTVAESTMVERARPAQTIIDTSATEPDHPAAQEGSAVYDASVRIHVDLLDKLMAIAGEIVLARNQILQYSQQQGDAGFQNTSRQLNLITTELQEHVMKTRLQPLGNVWTRFPRLARDTAQACGKLVRLEMQGSETELDKALLEAIRDPLTHLVRNAIDHGIESPAERQAAGKPAEGCVRLRAFHEGGQVNVEVSDDGGGMNPERIRQKAVEQRLVTPEEAAKMGPQTVFGLIFLPGFSTAAAVTTLSGRGVGMDVVKTNIEKIGGSVDVQSELGRGTTVRIRIPLTLAIIKVLVVKSAGDCYAIPQVSIVELLRVEPEKARQNLQRVHEAQVYRYRDQLLPLVNLNQALRVEAEPATEDAINIVVLQAADRRFGLIVDSINDTQEIVVKPLWRHLKSLACYAGATVMGNGRVALILDVFGLAHRAGAITHSHSMNVAAEQAAALPVVRKSVLLLEGRNHDRLAIPLRQVERLEEFNAEQIEHVAEQSVVQYDGQILPLVDVSRLLRGGQEAPATQNEAVQVVVCSWEQHSVGLVVNRILDIVEPDNDVQGPASRPGIAFTSVVKGQVTEVLNLGALVADAALGGIMSLTQPTLVEV